MLRTWIHLPLAAALWGIAQVGAAQDARDEAIFGEAAPSSEAPAQVPSLADTLQVGGRLEVRSSSAQEEQQKFPEAGYSQLKQADVYFDSRPNKDLRAFLRARFSETTPVNAATSPCTDCARTQIDELWFKWDYADALFFTYGKQHLKWGSGRFWNPTDFTAGEVKDPFALYDRRLGRELLKLHIPMEKRGYNYYAVLQFDDVKRNDEVGVALRGEFAFAGMGELALSFQTRQDQPIRGGIDVSSALGPIDVHVEAAASKRQKRTFYRGTIDPVTLQLPQGYTDEDKTFAQVAAGVQYSVKYNDDDALTVGGEFFYNELGYDDRELELYALVNRDATPLYAGRRYAGVFMLLPNPGSWNNTSFYLNGMRNLSDETTVARVTGVWQLFKDASIEVFASRCFGDYGELCFRIPSSYGALSSSPVLTAEQKQILASLPTRRTMYNAGIGMSLSF